MIVIFNMKVIEIKTKRSQLKKIRKYLSDIINDHKTRGEWKIQLFTIAIKKFTIASNFFSSKDSNCNSNQYSYKCFQYAITVLLNHEQIKIVPEKILRTKLIINQYTWKEISFPSHKKDLHHIINQLLLIFDIRLALLKK